MKKFLITASLFAPVLALAQPITTTAGPNLGNIQILLQSIGRLVGLALPIVLALALLGFFWGLMRFIFAAGDAEKQKEGKGIMIWGAVAFFVMVSIWGIVRFIGNAFGIAQESTPITIPRVPGV